MEKRILALHERELPWNPTNLQTPRGSCELPVKILKNSGEHDLLQLVALHERCLCILKWSPCAATLILQRCSSNRWHLGSDLCSIFAEVDGKDLPPMDTGHIKTLITEMDLLHAWDLCETDGSMLLWRRM